MCIEGHNQQCKKESHRMKENICKPYIQEGINFQNTHKELLKLSNKIEKKLK
jgi:hypothetical protein